MMKLVAFYVLLLVFPILKTTSGTELFSLHSEIVGTSMAKIPLQNANDSDIYVVGYYSGGVFAAKILENGTTAWRHTYDSPSGTNVPYGACINKNGIYVFSRISPDGHWGGVMRIALDGNQVWGKEHSDGGGDRYSRAGACSENSGVLFATSFDSTEGNAQALLLNESNGDIIWGIDIWGSELEVIEGAMETSDSFVFVGYSISEFGGSNSLLVGKIFKNGFVDWMRCYGKSGWGVRGMAVTHLLKDGDSFIVGMFYGYVARISISTGKVLWFIRINEMTGHNEQFNSIEIIDDGESIILFAREETNGDMTIVKMNLGGQVVWLKKEKTGSWLSSNNRDYVFGSTKLYDGKIAFAGGIGDNLRWYLSIMDEDGFFCGEEDVTSSFTVTNVTEDITFVEVTATWQITYDYIPESYAPYTTSLNQLQGEIKLVNKSTCFGCYGRYSFNEENVCSSHGNCENEGNCSCNPHYDGEECDRWYCFGINASDTQRVCSGGNGTCVRPNVCECESGYFSFDCSIWGCFNFTHDSTFVCGGSSQGNCSEVNKCDCKANYYGSECEITTCDDVFSNDTGNVICSTHGKCISHDVCQCDENYLGGQFCDYFTCDGIGRNDSRVCSGHGNCTTYDNCTCLVNYNYTSDCSSFYCNGIEKDDKRVCSGHGDCLSHENCHCPYASYPGKYCDQWGCYNSSWIDIDHVCGGHGICYDRDVCICQNGYLSRQEYGPCDDWSCNKDNHASAKSCNGRGKCVAPDECSCVDYEGNDCETWSCGAVDHKFTSTCNGHGKCVNPNQCKCDTGYGGKLCEDNLMYGTIMAPVLAVAGLSFIISLGCVICCMCMICLVFFLTLVVFLLCSFGLVAKQTKGLKRFSRLQNFDLLLKEQQLDEDTTVAHLRINKVLFEIPFDEIKTVSILGEGGSNSIVFKAKWKGIVVAFKCFKTRQLMSSQDRFDEFEREVEILGSLSHPNIIRFYGASMQKPRVGIVMEYACNGEILDYIKKFRDESGSSYPLFQKLRMMYQIASAMLFLHSRSIIHRDLKSENVLIDEKENTKLMDFGLSKLVDRMSVAKTLRVGTSVYMAPEIVSDDKYTEKCDVFSFSILFYIIITETPDPYGSDNHQVEIKVANNPSYRPDLNKISFLPEEENQYAWITETIKKSWNHIPEERYSFKDLCGVIEKGNKQMLDGNNDIVASSSKSILSNNNNMFGVEAEGNRDSRHSNEVLRSEILSLKKKLENLQGRYDGLEIENERLKEENE